MGQFALMLAVGGLSIVCRDASKNPPLVFCGIAFLAIAAICGLGGAMALGRNLTPFPKPSAGKGIVQSGIYGRMRHPLYTSVFCAALGWSLVWHSWSGLAASLALAVFLDAKARREERWLRRRFPDYAQYAKRVRRFIPWIY
jgi:protein-S-isoprenylcysteine O-methyltransferase Ste14